MAAKKKDEKAQKDGPGIGERFMRGSLLSPFDGVVGGAVTGVALAVGRRVAEETFINKPVTATLVTTGVALVTTTGLRRGVGWIVRNHREKKAEREATEAAAS